MQPIYTLEELAKFLNRPAKDIQKLAEKEVLKGRKFQGKWVFALADVVLWMEKEMTRVEIDKTAELENAVSRVSGETEEDVSLASLLDVQTIDLAFSAKTKSSIINEIVKLPEQIGKLWDASAMAEALLEREEMASTALDHGVAIMHPRRPQTDIISEDFLALAIARKPIPFGGGFANETDVFFLLCCQTDVSYLRTLGKLARTLKTPGFLDELRECPDAESVIDLVKKTERQLS